MKLDFSKKEKENINIVKYEKFVITTIPFILKQANAPL